MIAGLVAVLVLAACGEKKSAQQQAVPGMGDMPAMQGMTMHSDSLMPMMRAHLDSMGTMPAQFAAAMLAQHDAMASRMLDAMGADMMGMGMKPDPAWTALTDSIRRDLADLPVLSGRTLDARLRAHVERMRRLMSQHEQMIGGR
ncbi:MAG: hypothetical protein ACREL9_00810 [Gemmatimonadales bacterium]